MHNKGLGGSSTACDSWRGNDTISGEVDEVYSTIQKIQMQLFTFCLSFHSLWILPPKSPDRRKIRLIESNAKCRYLKKLTCKRTFAAGVYLSEAPSPPRFLFGMVKIFCRF
jgi:hypothetical protein